MESAAKRFFFCADDYAQSGAISFGILDLLEAERLSATSVMVWSSRWPEDASMLRRLGSDCAIGLHLDLTHPTHRPMGGVGTLLMGAHLRLLSRKHVLRSFQEQVDRFSQAMGRRPDFLDGHQHVHALPQIRDAFAELIAHQWPAEGHRPWARATDRLRGQTDTPLKAVVVRQASRGFSALMVKAGVPVSACFGGLYSLAGRSVRPLMKTWLEDLPDGTWLMVHPGRPSQQDLTDPIRKARAVEYEHLRGACFLDDLASAQATVFRGRLELLPQG